MGSPPGPAYDGVDPARQLPLDVPVWCVHGRDDDVVPLSQSVDYVSRATAAGAQAELVEVEGDHFVVIDTASRRVVPDRRHPRRARADAGPAAAGRPRRRRGRPRRRPRRRRRPQAAHQALPGRARRARAGHVGRGARAAVRRRAGDPRGPPHPGHPAGRRRARRRHLDRPRDRRAHLDRRRAVRPGPRLRRARRPLALPPPWWSSPHVAPCGAPDGGSSSDRRTTRVQPLQIFSERVDEQVDVVLGGDERGREADGLAVGLLGQDAVGEERLGDLAAGAERRVDVDAGPQPARRGRRRSRARPATRGRPSGARRASSPAPGTHRSAASRPPRGRSPRRAGCRRRSTRASPA